MTAHVLYEEIDPQYPASMSESIIKKILIDELRFKGVIIADNIEMKALINHYALSVILEKTINAGNDMIILNQEPDFISKCVEESYQLFEKGLIKEEDLNIKNKKIENLKEEYIVKNKISIQESKKIIKNDEVKKLLIYESENAVK